MLQRRKGLFLGLFHPYAFCADNSQTYTWCKVSIQALSKSPGHHPLSSRPIPPSILPSDFSFQTQLSPYYFLSWNMVQISLMAHRIDPQGLCLAPARVFSPLTLISPSLPIIQQNRVLNISVTLLTLLPTPTWTSFCLLKSYPIFKALLKFLGCSFRIHLLSNYFPFALCWSLLLSRLSRFYLYYGRSCLSVLILRLDF